MTEKKPLPTTAPRWKRSAGRIGTGACLAYATWILLLWLNQDRLVFPRLNERPSHDEPREPPENWESIWITTPSGQRVEGWFGRGEDRSDSQPGPSVLYFHGNGAWIDDCFRAPEVQAYRRAGLSVLLAEFRGYGRSQGRPSEQALIEDGVQFAQALAERPEVDRGAIIYHGRSLGGGIAVQVAARRPPKALILESTFTSMASLTTRYGAPSFLCRHAFRNDRLVGKLQLPILITHGKRDDVVGVEHGRQLSRLVPHAQYLETEAGHNDRPAPWENYWQELLKFLTQTGIKVRA